MSGAGKTEGGTRFRIYAQSPVGPGPHPLETVSLSPPAGSLDPGPADRRMYTVVPIGKLEPYGIVDGPNGPVHFRPPWPGPVQPPVRPDDDGHFDYLSPGDPGFVAAHLYGTARFVLDVWEGYLQERIRLVSHRRFERLELTANRDRRVAKMGRGYLEVGQRAIGDGERHDYALNFDVIAHEVGHFALDSIADPTRADRGTDAYDALHEMNADAVAMITALHFDSVVEEVLESTGGNLDSFNTLSRIGEFDRDRQIRLATNDRTVFDFVDGWESEHDLAAPLIGAFFDIFIDLYHEELVESGAVSAELERLADRAEQDARLRPAVRDGFAAAFERNPDAFRQALRDARDMGAHMLVEIWRRVRPERFRLGQVARWLRDLDRETQGGRYQDILARNLALRGIGLVEPGPRRGRSVRLVHAHAGHRHAAAAAHGPGRDRRP
ncbi:MAG: hypothetical protein AAFZ09_02775 [Pseudomonadota bacterium]